MVVLALGKSRIDEKMIKLDRRMLEAIGETILLYHTGCRNIGCWRNRLRSASWVSRCRGVPVGLKVHADRDKSFHRWISKNRDTGFNQLSRCRHTVAVQRAICALNRNALWNNAQDLARDKGYYCCCQSVSSFVVSVVARCRGLVPTFFLCLVDPLYSDRIWKCLPNELLLPVMGYSLFRTQTKIVVKGNCWGERFRQRQDVHQAILVAAFLPLPNDIIPM